MHSWVSNSAATTTSSAPLAYPDDKLIRNWGALLGGVGGVGGTFYASKKLYRFFKGKYLDDIGENPFSLMDTISRIAQGKGPPPRAWPNQQVPTEPPMEWTQEELRAIGELEEMVIAEAESTPGMLTDEQLAELAVGSMSVLARKKHVNN